jgi:uncharacterized protein (DUF302 family)
MDVAALAYTVTTQASVEEAVERVQEATARHGFRVLGVHAVDTLLAEKGFPREPYRIIEVCSARHASQVLAADVGLGLFLPCKVNVYAQGGQTHISALRPTILTQYSSSSEAQSTAQEVDAVLRAIVDEAR